ncbi:MAG TPA: dienelactone hydrolase family protein [Longimicrobiaceae bacterium]|jgi:carboxymethylenebutenolidase|nr:dienelactone hydrolase family protein [Longimicrobiaceae bacterium]
MRRTIPLLLTLVLATACSRTAAMNKPNPADSAHVDAMARMHANETPAPNASAAEPRRPVTAEEVTYATVDGKPVRGYLARPSGGAGNNLPALVVIHEWWGLNDNVRMMTRRLAGEGYQALAVDLYGGEAAATPAQATALMRASMANPAGGQDNLKQAAAYLRSRGAPKLGVIGWCFGGGWSLESALFMPDQVDADVVYYGRPVTDRARLAALRAPLLGLYGGLDQGIPVATVRQMETELRALGKNVDIHVYPDANHAFANPSGQSYNPAAAEDAWRRTVVFFNQHLQHGARR